MSRVDHLNRFEREERRRWLANAAHHHFGMCGSCHRTHDHEGDPLYVARQRRRRVFECLECFAFPAAPAAAPASAAPQSGRTPW